MTELDLQHLVALTFPVLEGFRRIEPKPWDRQAVLLELLGEIGSLAHAAQQREGFKRGAAPWGKLTDECCDVIFIAIRLACEDGVTLPDRLTVPPAPGRPSGLILQMNRDLAELSTLPAPREHLLNIIAGAAAVAAGTGVNLVTAYEREMAVAAGFFSACGEAWPHPRPLRHPLATLRLWRLLWRRRSSPPE